MFYLNDVNVLKAAHQLFTFLDETKSLKSKML